MFCQTINAMKDKFKANEVEILTEEGLDMSKDQQVPFIKSLKVILSEC